MKPVRLGLGDGMLKGEAIVERFVGEGKGREVLLTAAWYSGNGELGAERMEGIAPGEV